MERGLSYLGGAVMKREINDLFKRFVGEVSDQEARRVVLQLVDGRSVAWNGTVFVESDGTVVEFDHSNVVGGSWLAEGVEFVRPVDYKSLAKGLQEQLEKANEAHAVQLDELRAALASSRLVIENLRTEKAVPKEPMLPKAGG
jgi:hypothetical protein